MPPAVSFGRRALSFSGRPETVLPAIEMPGTPPAPPLKVVSSAPSVVSLIIATSRSILAGTAAMSVPREASMTTVSSGLMSEPHAWSETSVLAAASPLVMLIRRDARRRRVLGELAPP